MFRKYYSGGVLLKNEEVLSDGVHIAAQIISTKQSYPNICTPLDAHI
jgi:hypothetical protein